MNACAVCKKQPEVGADVKGILQIQRFGPDAHFMQETIVSPDQDDSSGR